MKDLYEYLNYQQFLEDLVAARKQEKEWFSLRYLADKIGMDQGNLVRVFQGKRHLSSKSVERLACYLDLDARRTQYLKTLVAFNKARSDSAAKQLFEQLMSLAAPEAHILGPQQYEFYRKWQHTAIYTLLDCIDFRGDYAALAAQLAPAISPEEAQESVELLLRLGLVSKRSDGRLIQTHAILSTGDSWRSFAVHSFQEATLKLALHSLENQPRQLRDFSTMSVSIAASDLFKIRELAKEFRANVLKVVQESEPADTVYQVNMQIFPMSRSGSKGGR